MTWPQNRKLVELEQKLSSIDSEFAHWRTETSVRGPLPAHNSQVLRVTRQLGALTAGLWTWLGRLEADSDRLLAESRQVEEMILDVHRIWDFFRSKLAQRYVNLFARYLVVADEFASACYDCARSAADPRLVPGDRVTEPPLVFLNGGLSPFALSRGAAFEAEWVEDDEITTQQFLQVLKDLPIPVIGVPWYQVHHLPDVVAIGHEVAHSIEEDFALTARLPKLLDASLDASGVPDERRAGWRAWVGEVFADLYGSLSGGPAFVSGLMDFLALSPRQTMAAVQPDPVWLPHPPNGLRVLLNIRALERLGFDAAATSLRSEWTSQFPRHAMAAFDADIDAVVGALIEGPYPELSGKALDDVIRFGPTEMAQAEAVKDDLLHGVSPAAPIRPMVAGARLAFEGDPKQFVGASAGEILLTTVAAKRSFSLPSFEDVQPEVDPDQVAAVDAEAGGALFERLRQLRSGQ